jgi:hypothetical protein
VRSAIAPQENTAIRGDRPYNTIAPDRTGRPMSAMIGSRFWDSEATRRQQLGLPPKIPAAYGSNGYW